MADGDGGTPKAKTSWKLFWSVFGALFSGVLGTVGLLADLPALVIALAVVAAAVFCVGAHVMVHGAEMFEDVSPSDRKLLVGLMAGGAVAHAVWVLVLQVRPDLWQWCALAMVALAVVEYCAARAADFLLATMAKPVQTEVERHAGMLEPDDELTKRVRLTLRKAGLDYLGIAGWEPIGQPDPYGIGVYVQEPSHAVRQAANTRAPSRLSPSSTEGIAIALSEVLEREIMTDWVQVQKERAAGRYKLMIVTEDVMGRVHPFQDDFGWTSFETPMRAGYALDGQPRLLRVDQCGQVIGASGGGKSSFLHTQIAHCTRAGDGQVWVCGTEKLLELVGEWLEPYRDQDMPVPLDWVASGQQGVVNMLAAGMSIAHARQRVPMRERKPWQKILIILDEAAAALTNRDVVAPYLGGMFNASQLVEKLVRHARSGGVSLVLADQRSTVDNKGQQGGNISANIGYNIAFRSNDPQEVGRLMGDFQLPNPRHKGSYWLSADGELPALLKGEYIQESDPNRTQLHDGLTVEAVAWSRRNFVKDPLDDISVAAAGDAYADRHRLFNAEFEAYLNSDGEEHDTAAPSQHAVSPPVPALDSEEAGREAVRTVMDEYGLPRPSQPAVHTNGTRPAAHGGGVATMERWRSRADRVAQIVRDADQPITRADIIDELRAGGDTIRNPQVVQNALGQLVNDEVLDREGGGYVAR